MAVTHDGVAVLHCTLTRINHTSRKEVPTACDYYALGGVGPKVVLAPR